jgi:N-acylneuraminate cytidylyltransferase
MIALVPMRGGSKSIPFKNIKEIAGKPLCWWSISALQESESIDKIYVSTDSEKIKETVKSFGFDKIVVVDRDEKNATDTSSTEDVLMEFAENHDFEDIMLIQVTSPLISKEDIEGGVKEYKNYDSVLSLVRQKRFIWEESSDGSVLPSNYNISSRPRRQDFNGHLVENGAFYITSKKQLMKYGVRLSGKIGHYEMCEETYIEIDEPHDWNNVETMLIKSRNPSKDIKMLIMDCDGTLTNGKATYDNNGDITKEFSMRDGMGHKLIREAGIKQVIISGSLEELIQKRGDKLQLDHVILDSHDKVADIKPILEKHNISWDNVAYIGDDINDYDIMKKCGFTACPNDALPKIKKIVDYICDRNGGDASVREFMDIILDNR